MYSNWQKLPCSRTIAAAVLTWVVTAPLAAQASDFYPLPGAADLPGEVLGKIDTAWSRTESTQIRSQHLQADGTPKYANRLLLEKSPYLRQHAHNPVNWFPWGDPAFAEAQRRGVPVLLSIGYSACHWCHVIEEESYDDVEVAGYLNQNFVAIKVDRESNPEVDELHMLAVQVMGRSGGWPLHVFLTPQREPFIGMTYEPREAFMQILQRVHEVWTRDQAVILSTAAEITRILQGYVDTSAANVRIGRSQVESVITQLIEEDESRDEFSVPTPRFPSEPELFLLLDAAMRYQHGDALALAEKRLVEMAFGGIRDHVGGGFHRYTVDREWLIPHFEKMLYNQAQIALAYLYAYELTAKALYRRVAVQTLDYVLRDMTDGNGVFFSATDADSEGEEGRFFVWTPQQIIEAASEHGQFAIEHYGATSEGNFEGVNILFVPVSPEHRAQAQKTEIGEYLKRLSIATERMRVYRDKREHPFLDRKVITAWNALMITTLSEASRITGDTRYRDAAVRAADEIWHNHRGDSGNLYRISIDGQLTEPGKLRDYAYYLQALVSVYDRTGDRIWLERGEQTAARLLKLFWDIRRGGLYSTAADDSKGLIVRTKDRFDGALPSGNSVAAKSLSQLYHRTGDKTYESRARQIFQAFGTDLNSAPSSWIYALTAILEQQLDSAGMYEYGASGHAKVSVSISAASDTALSATVEIDLDEGWHVQSDRPAAENLIGTKVSVSDDEWTLAGTVYPPPEMLSTEFQPEPISVWSDKVEVQVRLERNRTEIREFGPVIEVLLQACDDTVCLLPETVTLEIPIGAIRG
ncbi:MAG: DUF255 domain-containing protein [Acidiferrobacterales bacterium]|nr:DUF255 domain-containing protein [Acidiferrobacterales bacterium]